MRLDRRIHAAEAELFAGLGLDVHESFVKLTRTGLQIRLLEHGSGAPVLLLHGVSLSAAVWAPMFTAVSDYRLIALDLPGHGLSDPVAYRRGGVREHSRLLIDDTFDAVGLESAPVIGHSLGGMFALWHAATGSARISALVLIGDPAVALPGVRVRMPLSLLTVPGLGEAVLRSPRVAPSGRVAMIEVYPDSAPQAPATTDLVNELRHRALPPLERHTGVPILVGGLTAASVDFSRVLSSKMPVLVGIVVLLSALLLFARFRSLVIPVQAALMNLLSIGGALGATVAVFQTGWLGSVLGVQRGPIEPWIPVLIFAVVFGLSMDYEVFLISRVREQWVRHGNASGAVAEGITSTGRVITAAAAIMVCVFLSFMLGNQRTVKEFGFALAFAVFLDALVVRCVLLPAVLELLGAITWRLPRRLEARLPRLNIEGSNDHGIELAGEES